ncbi:unnamed protein product [Ixodes pacificus]
MDAFKLDDPLPSSTEESAKLSELGFGAAAAAAEFGFFELKKEGYEEKQACYFEPGDYKEYTPLPPYPTEPSPGSTRTASPTLLYETALPESSAPVLKPVGPPKPVKQENLVLGVSPRGLDVFGPREWDPWSSFQWGPPSDFVACVDRGEALTLASRSPLFRVCSLPTTSRHAPGAPERRPFRGILFGPVF